MAVNALILLSVIAALVLGILIVVLVEGARAHARRRTGPRSGAAARQLQEHLRHEVGLTRQAVAQAAAQGVEVDEIQQVVAEIADHAQGLDRLLGTSAAVPGELRDRHRKLTAVCVRIRTDLADVEARRSSAALDDTLTRAQLGVEALQLEHGVPEDPTIAEIRKELDARRDIGEI